MDDATSSNGSGGDGGGGGFFLADEDWLVLPEAEGEAPPLNGQGSRHLPDAFRSTSFYHEEDEPPVYRSLAPPQLPVHALSQSSFGASDPSGLFDGIDASHPGPYFDPNPKPAAKAAHTVHPGTVKRATEPPPLSPLIRLERTNFRSQAPAETIFQSLTSALEQLKVVHIFNASKCQFRCSANHESATVHFYLRIFSDKDDRVVECQRRNDCGPSFWRVYESIFQEVAHLHQQPIEPAQRAGQYAVNMEVKKEHLPPLKGMLDSPYADVQCEGLRSLAVLSQSSQSADVLLSDRQLIEALVRHLSSEHIECQTQAVKLLATAARHAMQGRLQLRPELRDTLPPLVDALCRASTTVCVMELQRQCCMALTVLANGFAADIVQARGREALELAMDESANAVLAREARTAHAMLVQAAA